MTVFRSNLDTRSQEFRRNEDALKAQVADLRAKVDEIRQGGGTAARERRSIVGGVRSRPPPSSVVVPPDGGIGGGHPPFGSLTRSIVGSGATRIADVRRAASRSRTPDRRWGGPQGRPYSRAG